MSKFSQIAIDGLSNVDPSQIPADASFTIEQRITAGDEMADQYHVVIDAGSIDVHTGPATHPDVVMTQDVDTAEALRVGRLHAQGAFLTGRLSIDGDVNGLLEFGPVLSQLLSHRETNA